MKNRALDITEWALKNSLVNLMSDISERCYCAGWEVGNGYILWGMVVGDILPKYGQSYVSETELGVLKLLSERLNGWFYWPKGADDKVFIEMDKWLVEYKEQANRELMS